MFFSVDGKQEWGFHLLMFWCEKNIESNLASAWKEFKAGGFSSLLSLEFIHKLFFCLLFICFFMSWFGCSEIDEKSELIHEDVTLR